jgi:hypothetical protein
VLLIGLTGFLEGPAYSGTITLRQRLAPPGARAQVMATLAGASMCASSISAAVAGAVSSILPLILAFTAVNLLAALIAGRGPLWRPRGPVGPSHRV